MKMKIKIRDLTLEQGKNYCRGRDCEECLLHETTCHHFCVKKDLYSDKFLDQEIEIDVPEILEKKEHDYLEAIISPWREKVQYIIKGEGNDKSEYIGIVTDRCGASLYFPLFPKGTMYKGMETDKRYTLEKLGL